MKFAELDRRMRVFETAHDVCVPPGVHMVARLDGRGFTRLLRERRAFAAPFDPRFRDMMVETGRHLMACGFNVLFCYSQSDELSLLFHPGEDGFGRKLRKLNSVLAGEASGRFSLLLGEVASFDCRISQLPEADDVVDYFRWRHEDAHRNALHAHCYWLLRSQGRAPATAQAQLDGLSLSAKTELLSAQGGIAFDDVPLWERRGWGLRWETTTKAGVNPQTDAAVTTERRRLALDLQLPAGGAFGARIAALISEGVDGMDRRTGADERVPAGS